MGVLLLFLSGYATAPLERQACTESILQSGDGITTMAFSPDGRTLATGGFKRLATGDFEGTVELWDVATCNEKVVMQRHAGWVRVRQVMFSPDSKSLAVLSGDFYRGTPNELRVWEVATGKELLTLKGHTAGHVPRGVTSVAFSPDSKVVAIGTGGDDRPPFGHVVLWDLATGQELRLLKGHKSMVTRLTFSPNGQALASADLDGVVMLWDMTGRKDPATLTGHKCEVAAMAFSPDGQTLATAGWSVRLWNVAKGKEGAVLEPKEKVFHAVAFSPDGQFLATGGQKAGIDGVGYLALWDVRTGEQLHDLFDAERPVTFVAFRPDGKTLVSGGDMSGPVRFWDVRSGDELLAIARKDYWQTGVALSPDGKMLTTTGIESTEIEFQEVSVVRFWSVPRLLKKK